VSARLTQTAVGFLVILTGLVVTGAAVSSGVAAFGHRHEYRLTADFPSVAGLKVGAPVEIAGVPVGDVASVALKNYEAHVVLRLRDGLVLDDASVAAIKSHGLIGEVFVAITPGHGGRPLPPGGHITHVVAAVNLEDAIASYIFGKI
jgi:phospholipid/cholesterol/gamma-HCH transport system substrate-binding protein